MLQPGLNKGERDTTSKSSTDQSVTKEVHRDDWSHSKKPTGMNHKLEVCESSRQHKRKQENVKIYHVRPDLDVREAQEGQIEAGEDSLSDSSGRNEMLRRCKRKLETGQLHGKEDEKSRVDVSDSIKEEQAKVTRDHKVAITRGLSDIQASPSTKFGASHDPCSIGMDVIEEIQSEKLKVVLLGLIKTILGLAGEGSKNCMGCFSIKEAIRKTTSQCRNLCDVQLPDIALVNPNVPASPKVSLHCDVQDCRSPVCSCTNGKTRTSIEVSRKEDLQDNAAHQVKASLPFRENVPFQKHGESSIPSHDNKVRDLEEGSDVECHLCIELASSQSEEDQDTGVQCGLMERYEFSSLEDAQNHHDVDLDANCEEIPINLQTEPSHGKVAAKIGSFEDEGNYAEGANNERKKDDCPSSGITRISSETSDVALGKQVEGDGFIDLQCGCTSERYGDTVGILRLYKNGMLEIYCHCSPVCLKGKPMSPASFERHGGRGASKKWKDTIWIVLGGQKVQFSKVKGLDAFVRRYKQASHNNQRPRLRQQSVLKKHVYHRDEFVQCKKCLKKRRFRRKNKEECWLFHEASMNPEWECSNYPSDSFLSCQDDEEREARRANRGCARLRTCEGCIGCVCLGCFNCRFEDCSCRICIEYIENNKHVEVL